MALAPVQPKNSLPDYAILFWHRVSDWSNSNLSIHGSDPSSTFLSNTSFKVFGQHPLGVSTTPDIPSYYTPNRKTTENINYVVRCVADANNWPSICDLRYDANTNMSANQSSLLFNGGAHGYNLVGRNKIPPLKGDYGQTNKLIRTPVYTYPHSGHTHKVNNLYNSVTSINPGSSNYFYQANASYVPQSFGSFFVDPIIKDPKLSMKIITSIPKDIIVMYYGNSTLPAGFYDKFDVSYDSIIDVSANGTCIPITFSQTNYALESNKIGAMNTNILRYDPALSGNNLVTRVINKKFANNINFQIYSDYSGYHDHKANTISKYVSSSLATAYDIIPESLGAVALLSNPNSPTGPDTISHTHKVLYTTNMRLKSNKLKAYLSTNPNSPIVKGLIIGYSIGKYSGFTGPSSSGKNVLPKGWYFCDGQNGTPDLRGRYPFLNFSQNDATNGVSENSSSTITITNVEVETINWQHGHAYLNSKSAVIGGAGKVDVGSHSSLYDATSDSTNTTRHNHQVSLANTITGNIKNATTGSVFDYEPPTVEIAFIMYNDTI